jgi:hypothetical protein
MTKLDWIGASLLWASIIVAAVAVLKIMWEAAP